MHASAARSLGSVPRPRSGLVGRDSELAAARALLLGGMVPLLTLTGPGGVGKTVLAQVVARDIVDRFAAGTVFVDFSPLADPGLVLPTIARTFDVPDAGSAPLGERLVAALGAQHLLLVLDNCEHLVESIASAAADLLHVCPHLQILAASRAPLRVRGEHELPIAPLAVPALYPESPNARDEAPAVTLFVQRARAVDPAFALTDRNRGTVAEICRRLDGLPLALELAAARSKVLAPDALLAHLANRLAVLTDGPRDAPARQRTMRDTIAWSHALLTPEEQAAFRRLAVFAGGFTVDAASVALDAGSDAELNAVAGITALVDHSLLSRREGPDPRSRFRMLETVREFALEQLATSEEEAVIRGRHMEHFARFAEEVAAPLYANPEPALARVNAELDNLRAALAWARDRGEATQLIRIAAALVPYWHLSGQLREGREWLEEALSSAAGAPIALRATLLREAGSLIRFQGEHRRAEGLAQESEGLWRNLGDPAELAQALVIRGHVAEDQGQFARSLALHEEALRLLEPLDARFWTAIVHRHVGWLSLLLGNLSAAELHLETALARFRREENPFGTATVLSTLGELAFRRGEYDRAAALKQELLHHAWDVWNLRNCLERLAMIAAASGQHESAARLLGAAEAYRERLGIALVPSLLPQQGRAVAELRSTLGEAAFAAAWEEGRNLAPDEARAEATLVASEPPAGRPGAASGASYGLTPRELDVLRLVADGRSNAEIAAALFVSPRTVTTHLTSVYTKLGVSSRTAAVAAARRHNFA